MIYFNKDKQAFAFEIEDAVCSIPDEMWFKYAGTDKWDVVDGVFTDITSTPEYIEKKEKERILKHNEMIHNELKLLDERRIRALAEPDLKDLDSGETWLEFYNAQIKELRSKLIVD